jgi:hypothetical protein
MSETFTYDNLIAGSQKKIVQIPGTIAIGQSFSRGQILGLKTSGLQWEVVDFGAVASYSDIGFAVEAVDTLSTEATTVTTIYVEGEFNENAVIIGYGDDMDDWRVTLNGHGLYLRTALTTEGVQ